MKKTPPSSKSDSTARPGVWVALGLALFLGAFAVVMKVMPHKDVVNNHPDTPASQAVASTEEVAVPNVGAPSVPTQSTNDNSVSDPKRDERAAMLASLGFGTDGGHKVSVDFSKREDSERVPFAKSMTTNGPTTVTVQ